MPLRTLPDGRLPSSRHCRLSAGHRQGRKRETIPSRKPFARGEFAWERRSADEVGEADEGFQTEDVDGAFLKKGFDPDTRVYVFRLRRMMSYPGSVKEGIV